MPLDAGLGRGRGTLEVQESTRGRTGMYKRNSKGEGTTDEQQVQLRPNTN